MQSVFIDALCQTQPFRADLTCFAFTGGVKVVVGAQQLALSVRPAVVDARRQVRAHVDLRGDIRAHLEPGEAQIGER